jgi:hypothetical protein
MDNRTLHNDRWKFRTNGAAIRLYAGGIRSFVGATVMAGRATRGLAPSVRHKQRHDQNYRHSRALEDAIYHLV